MHKVLSERVQTMVFDAKRDGVPSSQHAARGSGCYWFGKLQLAFTPAGFGELWLAFTPAGHQQPCQSLQDGRPAPGALQHQAVPT